MPNQAKAFLSAADIAVFRKEGVVCLRGTGVIP